jgi:hypothetical protein
MATLLSCYNWLAACTGCLALMLPCIPEPQGLIAGVLSRHSILRLSSMISLTQLKPISVHFERGFITRVAQLFRARLRLQAVPLRCYHELSLGWACVSSSYIFHVVRLPPNLLESFCIACPVETPITRRRVVISPSFLRQGKIQL